MHQSAEWAHHPVCGHGEQVENICSPQLPGLLTSKIMVVVATVKQTMPRRPCTSRANLLSCCKRENGMCSVAKCSKYFHYTLLNGQ